MNADDPRARLVEFAAAEAAAHALMLAGESDEECAEIRRRAWEALADEERQAIEGRWGELLDGLARKVHMQELSAEQIDHQARACADYVRRGGARGASGWLASKDFDESDRAAIILRLSELDAEEAQDRAVDAVARAATVTLPVEINTVEHATAVGSETEGASE
jgi:hypothetical protein